jgi:hypothetical protein
MSNWTNTKLSQSSSSIPNSDVSLRKKHYRARGCRGGASRKGRKKQLGRQQPHDDREAQENLDPSNSNVPTSGFIAKDIHDIDDHDASNVLAPSQSHNIVSDKHSYTSNVKSQGPEKVTFAPHSSHHTSSEKHLYNNNIVEPSKDGTKLHKFIHPFAGRGNKNLPSQTNPEKTTTMSILPKESDGNIELLLDESAPIERPVSPASSGTKASPARSPGFSFFSISPRSYLTGRKSKVQKLN